MIHIWIFIGPPGSGKGSQAHKLKTHLNLAHLSTGDLLRDEIKSGSSLGLGIQAIVDSGKLVPDHLVLEIIKKRLDSTSYSDVLLDGYPRTLVQAQDLIKLINSNSHTMRISGVILFEIDDQTLIQRAVSRRLCNQCGAIYNIISKPPKQDHICDLCGGTLIQRKDDFPGVVIERIELYKNETWPIVNFFKNQLPLYQIDARNSEEQIFDLLLKTIKNSRQKNE